ncbi:MAG: hypothetical protein Q9187_000907 [Circinaria calcarea]
MEPVPREADAQPSTRAYDVSSTAFAPQTGGDWLSTTSTSTSTPIPGRVEHMCAAESETGDESAPRISQHDVDGEPWTHYWMTDTTTSPLALALLVRSCFALGAMQRTPG